MTSTILIVVACVVAAGVIGLVTLIALSSGKTGPRRFAVAEPTSLDDFFTEAPWVATVRVTVPHTPAQVWKQATDGPFVEFGPLIRGPQATDGERQYRGLIAATSRTVHSRPDTGLVAVGTGVSVPLAVKSFTERVRVTDARGGAIIDYTLAVAPRFIGFLPLQWTVAFFRPFITAAIKRAF